MTRVTGLDLSLTATGIALPDPEDLPHVLTPPKKLSGIPRLIWIKDTVMAALARSGTTHLFLEDYAFTRSQKAHYIGELGGVVRLALHYTPEIKLTLVGTSQLKKFATGSGNGSKDDVLAEAIRRLGYQGSSKDEADALWLRELGRYVLGESAIQLPKKHLEQLAKVKVVR